MRDLTTETRDLRIFILHASVDPQGLSRLSMSLQSYKQK
jgi:hypothetical protein